MRRLPWALPGCFLSQPSGVGSPQLELGGAGVLSVQTPLRFEDWRVPWNLRRSLVAAQSNFMDRWRVRELYL